MKRLYSVTGELHGAHVLATSCDEAKKIFAKHYPSEKILKIRQWSISEMYEIEEEDNVGIG
jgi:uncharacterized protein YhbP (UPF0306 family)